MSYGRSIVIFFLLSTAQLAYACADAQVAKYEDAATSLKGKIIWISVMHPNGTNQRLSILRLQKPINVYENRDGGNQFDQTELCVKEIQLIFADTATQKKLKHQSNYVAVGKLFHEHTAWHRRKILMDVQ
ncbi:hypothetical protein [Variovorax sp. PCZ-1]|uniref:hypothetical protein n=1 Tax=Variovorax sp. PCZ-1 TaxID=2835533 RepID=UPI001BD18818|nr:hypothetical protein [Variovorax sp. PCZ-1]MBS7808093.1 hypothetical protein [Variovorax sp. PCZ-1]